MKRFFSFVGACVLLCGCTPKSGETVPTSNTAPSGSPTTQAPQNGGDKTSTAATNPAPKPAQDLSLLPENLKSDAYEYYGLGNGKPMDYQVTSSNGDVYTGTQTLSLQSVGNGKATFDCDRTGGYENLVGDDVYTLEPDGIYMKSSTVATTKGHDLEMPAKLAPGTKWSVTNDIEIRGQAAKITNGYKVIGIQPVKTKKGAFNALLINSVGKGKIGSQSVTVETKYWYAKGIGLVKTEMKMTESGSKPRTFTIQLT